MMARALIKRQPKYLPAVLSLPAKMTVGRGAEGAEKDGGGKSRVIDSAGAAWHMFGSVWNNLDGYEENCDELKYGVRMLRNNQLKHAKAHLLLVLAKQREALLPRLFSLLALVHFLSLEYFESEYYVKKGLQLTASSAAIHEHFLNCLLLIERHAGILGPMPRIRVIFQDASKPGDGAIPTRSINNQEDNMHHIFENKYLLDMCLPNTPYRQLRLCRHYFGQESFLGCIDRTKLYFADYSVFCVYLFQNMLYLYDLNSVMRVDINWEAVCDELALILDENKKVLQMNAGTDKEKRLWWHKRGALDDRLGRLIRKVALSFKIKTKDKLVLILDENTIHFPFECVFNREAYRVGSLETLFDRAGCLVSSPRSLNAKADTAECGHGDRKNRTHALLKSFYLLDADNNLANTRTTLSEFFRNVSISNLRGVDGRGLTKRESKELATVDLFMYFGHGSGRKHFDLQFILPWMLFLFGCSSCRLLSKPNFRYNGHLLNHLNKGRAILGTLWDITDKDLDRFTIGFLTDFFRGKQVGVASRNNSSLFKLRYINGAALVIYGLPSNTG